MDQDLKKKIILGLDISTRCIGSTVASLDDDGTVNILEISHLKLRVPSKYKGTKALFLKSELFKEKLKEKYTNYYITNVVIEEPLVSSNNSISVGTLMRFNGMISQTIKDVLDIVPEYISSYEARKYGCPELMAVRKYDKHGKEYSYRKIQSSIEKGELVLFGAYPFDCAKKFILWNYISDKFPNISWVYDNKNELKDENFDASDSLMCVLGQVKKMIFGEVEPEIVDCVCDKKKIEYTVKFCGESFHKVIEFD